MMVTSCSVTSDMLIPFEPREMAASANGRLLRIFSREQGTLDHSEGSLLCEIYDNPQPSEVGGSYSMRDTGAQSATGRRGDWKWHFKIRRRRKAGCRGEIG